ncbi:MAG: sigma-54 dependent transcriptional regulator [candidate division KSB1 bacterium]|nr:sigma-54 dependent transcriptional regulator [candidate division KSB1 bacterium]MDZ7391480.1 sigma-54 dependent transcriptional regulator [candidate division KSB1 bacterium]MDZ7414223.1 sigma-54 dependent transcriptional regulator [candidate division KSB1 bacterium]
MDDQEQTTASWAEETGFVAVSQAMQRVLRAVEQVAPTDISVLITGESGTGKELIAKAIHAASLRNDHPLVVVNCGAIPEGILESELFGHEKGSFTGAIGTRKGYFEIADKGTIFLDEIGEMPLATQVKILRVLEYKEFMRVGGSSTVKVDVRVIAATNKELEAEVKKGTFRQDLFFRLNAVTIHVPPLRERREDIRPMVDLFVRRFCRDNHIEFEGFTESAYHMLENYPWPGNVRQLKNLVESIIVLEKGKRVSDQVLARHLLPPGEGERSLPVPVGKTVEQVEREFIYRALVELRNEIAELRRLIYDGLIAPRGLMPWRGAHPEPVVDVAVDEQHEETVHALRDSEREAIRKALQATNNNRRKAAKLLGVSERTIYRKIKQYGL